VVLARALHDRYEMHEAPPHAPPGLGALPADAVIGPLDSLSPRKDNAS
jgi:hypothetical protein